MRSGEQLTRLLRLVPYLSSRPGVQVSAVAEAFGVPLEELFRGRFYLLTPNTSSPYRQLYTNQ